MSLLDESHMAHALAMAARGLGTTWPNPSVGCVLVKDGKVIGRGTTQPGGRPHAERMALAQAGEAARGATAYVTLEPCAHHGKTSPCAEALVAAGIARVVTALTDPDARVAGRGHAILKAAGIEVSEGVLRDKAFEITQGFLKRVTQGLPFVTLKLGATLDGRIATASGESRWITGPQSRRHVHAIRMRHDAVMVGSGTALADDPDLKVRDLGAERQPVRVVLDRMLRHNPESRLGNSAHEAPVWLIHGPDAPADAIAAWAAKGAKLLPCPLDEEQRLNLRSALEILAREGLTRVYAEGGGTVAASLIKAHLVDELAIYNAGALIGADGTPSLAALGLQALGDAPRLKLLESQTLGADIYSRWGF